MTHDIDDLLEIIRALEERIINLENQVDALKLDPGNLRLGDMLRAGEEYWEHG